MKKIKQLPSFETYCGPNAQVCDVGRLRVWYSYKTPVAYQPAGGGLVVRENDWGPTTGKHLNAIDGGDKKARIPGAQFEELLEIESAGYTTAEKVAEDAANDSTVERW